ncbi:twin-arginine translocase TatA/TatE family subunit [Stakelama pacifica]|uniref:Sec-independent protein translocase protein TatA n=1 Tax=Stakelama pacifica TaxID=517720 RepID=A0A4R6FSL0_9SPHN|nr:twin-arginine translocase TatA/TatE family subunit [Stakelama pacifica]TDN84597.1 sec-independent protein translocase protein TatA [Stakelama pacifica]GGO93338.1 Sec-independent protein translocase protein TatA [Stakelama pacifica]
MGGLSIWHYLVLGIVILLLFGKGRFSDMMGDVAKGIKSFKQGMTDEEEPKDSKSGKEPSRIESKPVSEPHYEHEADRHREER